MSDDEDRLAAMGRVHRRVFPIGTRVKHSSGYLATVTGYTKYRIRIRLDVWSADSPVKPEKLRIVVNDGGRRDE